ncbi:hypothetical protein OV079_17225 [Nannocystis pusilla]|jgi:hypothetical protein|uniref:Uncharacterized protein n=1 Tax=Nannocystis pusilla TaxID=889268 RepID=A0A9X3EP28_9BACT|nr:hypothetical protein [Nannocystis pusilla]MCY1007265.1 hypothetical protein [Nannocystis pusilla]
MTTPNQKNPQQQQGTRQDRGTGQTQDERQRNPQQGGRQQTDSPASTPRTDRDVQQQDYPNRNRTDMGDRTDVDDKGQQDR